MTGTQDSVTIDALGVPVGVHPTLARLVPHLPRTAVTPAARVDADHPDPVRALTHIAVTTTSFAAFHAGVVASRDRSIVFPGVSGAGKSTLVAACVAAGLGYLSDEVLAIAPATTLVVPFARPLALSAVSRQLIGIRDDDPHERFVPVDAVGSVSRHCPRVRHVVIPTRRPGAPVLVPVDASVDLAHLLGRSFNHYRFPRTTWSTVTAALAGVEVWEARYDDARAMADIVTALASEG